MTKKKQIKEFAKLYVIVLAQSTDGQEAIKEDILILLDPSSSKAERKIALSNLQETFNENL